MVMKSDAVLKNAGKIIFNNDLYTKKVTLQSSKVLQILSQRDYKPIIKPQITNKATDFATDGNTNEEEAGDVKLSRLYTQKSYTSEIAKIWREKAAILDISIG